MNLILFQELNKCKIELQYWRSKSTTLLALPSSCASCSAPLLPSQSAENAEAEIKALANQGIFLTEDLTPTSGSDSPQPPSTADHETSPPSPMNLSDKLVCKLISGSLDVQKQPQQGQQQQNYLLEEAGTSFVELVRSLSFF